MKRFLILLIWLLYSFVAHSQEDRIKSMRWGMDYKIYLEMQNDSSYVFNIDDLFHTPTNDQNDNNIIYYPVVLGESFLNQLKEREIISDSVTHASQKSGSVHENYTTLWSALHNTLDGNLVHFMNCLIYSLETRQLSLTAPLLKRPDTKWKPKPVTKTYKRTHKWNYYLPVNQKYAIKEYRIREKEGNLGDLRFIPQGYVELFLNTNNKEYAKLKESQKYKDLAKIDLVKIMLGANYLGVPQINYIKSMVLKAVLNYSVSQQLPTVIIFEDFNAAVAMRLDEYGYAVEKIVFKNIDELNSQDVMEKEEKINRIIAGINKVNLQMFEKRLQKYYQ